MKKKTMIIWIISAVAIASIFISFLVVQAKKPGKYDTFAQCIASTGTKFYGAWWCPHCQRQKALFGKSAKKLPYVECQTPDQKQTQACIDAEIKGYPTWIFADGSRQSGEIPLETLSEKTNCPLN